MKIPVFHDDQHGTAIVAGAAMLNGLKVVGKDIAKVKLVCSGAGAAAIACLDLLVGLGLKRENVMVCDSKGVIYSGPRDADGGEQGALRPRHQGAHAGRRHRAAPTSSSACPGRGVLTPDMVKAHGAAIR